jgi:hypothetical protein
MTYENVAKHVGIERKFILLLQIGIDSMTDAFLSPRAEALFSAVATFGDAQELEVLDVSDNDGQKPARRAIETVINNALNCVPNIGARIVLIKGEAGSGKSHVLTTTFKRVAALPRGEIYPAVLQLTAPVEKKHYDVWLLDALFRRLTERHFADDHNQSPLMRLAWRLIGRMSLDEQEEFLRLIDDLDDDGEIELALKFAKKIRKEAQAFLAEDPPREGFIAVVMLAGFGDSSAINYLRLGDIDKRIKCLDLEKIKTAHNRLELLKNFGLTAQIVGASLAIGFDQVENAVRLGSEELYVHTLTQAIRIVENVVNCAVVVASVVGEYDEIVGGKRKVKGLPAGDRDRIENVSPVPVAIAGATKEFLQKVVAQRLVVLRQRAKQPANPGSLEPLPNWFIPRIHQARNARIALGEVSRLREMAIQMGRIPSQFEYEGSAPQRPTPEPSVKEDIDYDKLWADFMDSAPATVNRLLVSTKAELLGWWAREASREHLASSPAEVTPHTLDDPFSTPIIDIVLKMNGIAAERRQLALCEAPNKSQQLAKQIERFLEHTTGTPMILRTNGFPKGKQTQVAGVLHKLKSLCGRQLDLGDTEWHNLQRAKDFADQQRDAEAFLAWRRNCKWLLQFLSPLQPLVEYPKPLDVVSPKMNGAKLPSPPLDATEKNGHSADTELGAPQKSTPTTDHACRFPVFIGTAQNGQDVRWAPYRNPPDHLNNFGFLITGDAGSGKTQTIRVLIDAASRENLSLLVFDFKGDYCDSDFADPLGIEVVDIRMKGLPFNPLQPPPRGASGVQPAEHSFEIAGTLSRVLKLGPVQGGILHKAITGAYSDAGIAPREWVDPNSVDWPPFEAALDRLRDEKGTMSLVTKLSPFCELGLFPATSGGASFESFINKRICLNLKALPTDEIKSALAEIIIIQLHGYALRGDQPRRLKRMVVFDEAHRVKDSMRLQTLAREGRAFGVGIVIGTQFPGDISETMAGNLATQLFLMNNQADHRRFVVQQIFGTTSGNESKELLNKLSKLKPFQGLFANTHYSGVLLDVLPYHARQKLTSSENLNETTRTPKGCQPL